MEIPVSVAINKFKQDIVSDINNSNLHISVIEMLFKDIYDEIKSLAQSTSQQESNAYQMALQAQAQAQAQANQEESISNSNE